MLQHFHFLQPLWLLALLPLMIIFWLAFQSRTDSKAWEKIIDAKLLPLLLKGEDRSSGKLAKGLLILAWLVSVFALADPVWEKIPRPIFQTNTARVIVLDLSNSMWIDDLKPNRLARARFKIEDILSRKEEGQTGLVLFAGDAFSASPLTRDTETIRSLLKILTPQLMPAQGSRADLGLVKAHELLKQSGINNGEVLLIADGVSQQNKAKEAAQDLLRDGHLVSVLAVGTESGGQLKFRNGNNVSVKLEAQKLSEIASHGGGKYHLISTNNSDLQTLLRKSSDFNTVNEEQSQEKGLQNQEWQSTGPFLVLFLLPLAALAFRKGWLLNLMLGTLLFGGIAQNQEAIAADEDKTEVSESLWQKVSRNKEQRADIALKQAQYELASELTDDPLRRGSAEYKQEKYQQALNSFQQAKGADARYNEGNAFAKLKKYPDAIASYEKALALDENMQDAIDNKKALEDFLKQQKQQNSKQSSDQNQQSQSEQQKNENQNSDQASKQDSGSDAEQNQDGENGEQTSDSKQGQKKEDKESQSGNELTDSEKKKDQGNQFSDANKSLDKQEDSDENDAELKDERNKEATSQKQDGSNQVKGNQEENKDEGLVKQERSDKEESQNSETEGRESILSQKKEEADELSKEEKMAAEQWLRRIPDDPGGLLRRKFKSQYRQRQRHSSSSEQPW